MANGMRMVLKKNIMKPSAQALSHPRHTHTHVRTLPRHPSTQPVKGGHITLILKPRTGEGGQQVFRDTNTDRHARHRFIPRVTAVHSRKKGAKKNVGPNERTAVEHSTVGAVWGRRERASERERTER